MHNVLVYFYCSIFQIGHHHLCYIGEVIITANTVNSTDHYQTTLVTKVNSTDHNQTTLVLRLAVQTLIRLHLSQRKKIATSRLKEICSFYHVSNILFTCEKTAICVITVLLRFIFWMDYWLTSRNVSFNRSCMTVLLNTTVYRW